MELEPDISVFVFGDAPQSSDTPLVAGVPCFESDPGRFLRAIGKPLRFPGYYGANWNALEECLNDFSWIHERVIVLVHDNVPQLSSDQLGIYLDILAVAICNWKRMAAHELVAIFPDAARPQIEKTILEYQMGKAAQAAEIRDRSVQTPE